MSEDNTESTGGVVVLKLFKIRKKLGDDVATDLESLDDEALQRRIARCEANVEESERARDNDDGLKSLREQVKDASGPYRDAVKHQRLIAKYATLLRESKGKL